MASSSIIAVAVGCVVAAGSAGLIRASVQGKRRGAESVAALWAALEPMGHTPAQLSYLRDSVLDSYDRASSRSGVNVGLFFGCTFVARIGTLALPVFASLNLGQDPSSTVRITTFVISLVVAVASGALQVFRFGSQWRIQDDFQAAVERHLWRYVFDGDVSTFGSLYERMEDLRDLRRRAYASGFGESLDVATHDDAGQRDRSPAPQGDRAGPHAAPGADGGERPDPV